ncbi:MAG: ABC transporter substrate-binding protein [Candidatus Pacebacteria bacterium]|nr:ABC transporter substrate-binding protein [Candidatus Paceibacterota bacterium]
MLKFKLKLLTTLGIAALITTALPVKAAEEIKLGSIEVLTGPASRYGISIKKALELAREEINQKGLLGGRKINIQYEDSAGAKDQAIDAARKLIANGKVKLIIGPTLSNEMFAVGPVVNERKIPIIGTSNTAKGITTNLPYVFRTSLPESDVVPVTLKQSQKKIGYKKVAILYANDDAFSIASYEAFKTALDAAKIEIVATETFANRDTDFSAQLNKIKAAKPDCIIPAALVEPVAGILLQARQMGLTPAMCIISGNGANSPKLMEIAGPAAEGLIVGTPWFVGKKDAINQKFIAAYGAKYNGEQPDQFAAQAYDTLYLIAAAITKAGSDDSEKLRQALTEVSNTGVLGILKFDDQRSPAVNSGVVVVSVKNGKFESYE